MQRHAIDHHRARRIDDRNLRLRRNTIAARRRLRRRVGIDMRDVKTAAIRARRDVTGAAAGSQPLLFLAGLRIQHGHVVARCGWPQTGACRRGPQPRWRAQHPQATWRSRSAFSYRSRRPCHPRCWRQTGASRRAESEKPRGMWPTAMFLMGAYVGRIQDAHFIAALAENIKARSIGREQHLHRRCIGQDLAGSPPFITAARTALRATARAKQCSRRSAQQQPRCAALRRLRAGPLHFGSSTVITRSTACFSSVCSRPLGQCTRILSTVVAGAQVRSACGRRSARDNRSRPRAPRSSACRRHTLQRARRSRRDCSLRPRFPLSPGRIEPTSLIATQWPVFSEML